jgi:hypothetical protein
MPQEKGASAVYAALLELSEKITYRPSYLPHPNFSYTRVSQDFARSLHHYWILPRYFTLAHYNLIFFSFSYHHMIKSFFRRVVNSSFTWSSTWYKWQHSIF